MYFRNASAAELPDVARLRDCACMLSRRTARWSSTRWNVLGSARHGEGSRAGGSCGEVSPRALCVGVSISLLWLGIEPGIGRGGLCSLGPSVGCCQASKRAPSSVASKAAAFSAAGVLGDVNRVCWCPMLTPMAEVTVSSSSSSSCSCSSGVASSSEGVRSGSSTDANRISARALCLSQCPLGFMGAGSAIAGGRMRVCVWTGGIQLSKGQAWPLR
jgi:hypothetical protein